MGKPADTGFGACRSGLASDLTNRENILIAMQPLLYSLRRVFDRVLQSALPDDGHSPAKCAEHLCMAPVASDILLEFLPPEVLIALGGGCVAAAFMSVPETAVDEYHRPVLWKHKIWGARQRSHMKSIPKPFGEKNGTKHPFRLGILSANARHHATALRSGRDAHGFGYFPPGYPQKQQPRASARQSEWMKARPEATFERLACA